MEGLFPPVPGSSWPGHRSVQRTGHRSGWESISTARGPLAHLRNLDNVGLLDKPGRLIIGISNQDRDFFCHLQRGKGDRSWESEAF